LRWHSYHLLSLVISSFNWKNFSFQTQPLPKEPAVADTQLAKSNKEHLVTTNGAQRNHADTICCGLQEKFSKK